MGLEPTRRCQHQILSLACLPIPALPQTLLSFVFLRNKTDYSIVFSTRQLLFSNFSKFFKIAKKIKKFKKGVDKQEILLYDRSVLERQHRKVHKNKNAEVAELADAQASGACGSNTVRVQVPPSALFLFVTMQKAGFHRTVDVLWSLFVYRGLQSCFPDVILLQLKEYLSLVAVVRYPCRHDCLIRCFSGE